MAVNIGDVVRISKGIYEGKLGVVKKIGSDKMKVRVAENHTNLVIVDFPQDHVRLV